MSLGSVGYFLIVGGELCSLNLLARLDGSGGFANLRIEVSLLKSLCSSRAHDEEP